MRNGLVNFQTKVWRSSFSFGRSFRTCTRRLRLPHSDCLKYLFTSSRASNYRARANVRLHPRVLRRALLIRATSLYPRYTRCAYISSVHKDDDVYRRKGGIPPVTSSWLIALSSSRSAHPPAERRDRKNSNFACATDKTASSYIWTTACLVGFYEARSRGYTVLNGGFP